MWKKNDESDKSRLKCGWIIKRAGVNYATMAYHS